MEEAFAVVKAKLVIGDLKYFQEETIIEMRDFLILIKTDDVNGMCYQVFQPIWTEINHLICSVVVL
jgi:hypothetical protein